MMTLEEVETELFGISRSCERMPKLLELAQRDLLDKTTFLQALGSVWSSCDNIGECAEDWDLDGLLEWAMEGNFTPGTKHIPDMMTPEEQRSLAALPIRVTIYRGCGPTNKLGYSWTLSRRVAEGIFEKAFYAQEKPILLTTTIDRANISALKLDGEEEIILLNAPYYEMDIQEDVLPGTGKV